MLLVDSVSNALEVVCECTDHRKSQRKPLLTIKVVIGRLLPGSKDTAQARSDVRSMRSIQLGVSSTVNRTCRFPLGPRGDLVAHGQLL